MFGFGNQPERIIKRSASRCSNETQGQGADLPQSEPQLDRAVAERRYDHALRVYQETRQHEHWLYLQRCIDDLK